MIPLGILEKSSVMSDSLRALGLWPTRLLSPWDFPGRNTEVGCHAFLQGIFPTQGLNPGLSHCRQILYRPSYQGSPKRAGFGIFVCSGSGSMWDFSSPTRDPSSAPQEWKRSLNHWLSRGVLGSSFLTWNGVHHQVPPLAQFCVLCAE